ncbi:AAA family ATPase [Leucothrix pacifica]|uniref:AAA family ATPase n=1 Tax=Leucothrix pacifica TaxID=1247513 RepID=A0A317CBD0_9GAMM|nr:MoxR family ATPase [Leucothrix pacifica]PWQ95441.1 AAA family ATPase [Leucothrix pacifica]
MLTLNDFLADGLTQQNADKSLNHIFNKEDCYALWSAYAAGRPLLVRGKPGTGKSQLAKAIAERLGWSFVSEVVRGSTELSDLHWNFDAIGRLGEAQVQRVEAPTSGEQAAKSEEVPDAVKEGVLKAQDPLDPLNFLSPGAFWWAYNWETAEAQYTRCKNNLRPKPEKSAKHNAGVVLLIDEIDKAEPDLPNGLLETLGNYQFSVPYIGQDDGQNNEAQGVINPIDGTPKNLLIIITTNEERELPTAFVRRCFVHTLKMQDSVDWLVERGELHFGGSIDQPVYEQAANQLLEDRNAALHGRYPPGLAEYIDLLRALSSVDKSEQAGLLSQISEYALKKEVTA